MSFWYRDTFAAKLKQKVSWAVHSLYVDIKPDAANTILVCGSGRSGTTWLAELINHANDFRFIAEPFEAAPCKMFALRQYLRPENRSAKYLDPAQAVFTGRIRDARVDSCNRRIIAHRRLVKDVRSNMMLKWIREHFQQMRIVFMIRHPYSVAGSRARLGWRTDLRNVYFAQDELMYDYLQPLVNQILRADTLFERHIVDWCVENLIPVKQLRSRDVYVIFYEHLLENPMRELQRLFLYLGQPFAKSILSHIGRPSMSSKDSVNRFGDYFGLCQRVAECQKATARDIVTAFGLQTMYDIYGKPSVESGEWPESGLVLVP